MTTTDDFDQFDDETPAPKAPARKATAKRPPKKAARPANAPKTRDREPKKSVQSGDAARRREADGVEVLDLTATVAGKSVTFEVPAHQGDWPVRTAQLMSRGAHIDGLESLLGPEQWDAYLALNPTMNHLKVLVQDLGEQLGFSTTGN